MGGLKQTSMEVVPPQPETTGMFRYFTLSAPKRCSPLCKLMQLTKN